MAIENEATALESTFQEARTHLRLGWWLILVYLTLGLVLEALHSFKVGWYLDVGNEARRLMFQLAHAHGVLMGVLNLAFAMTLRQFRSPSWRWQRVASRCLEAAGILLPAGFLLGGVLADGGDPGPGVLLVPFAGVLLFVSVLLIAQRPALPAGSSAEQGHREKKERKES